MEVVVRELDSQGHISIPKKWRKGWKSRKLTLIKRGDRIEIVPMQPIPPSYLFDSIQIPDNIDFTDPHSLKAGNP
jgi:bifunctional DNA-binding transcriptional regulator/antitoxin component of YhaV-PrlF toxin-antitoxin module